MRALPTPSAIPWRRRLALALLMVLMVMVVVVTAATGAAARSVVGSVEAVAPSAVSCQRTCSAWR